MVFPQIVYRLIFEMLPTNLTTSLYLWKDLKRLIKYGFSPGTTDGSLRQGKLTTLYNSHRGHGKENFEATLFFLKVHILC